MADIRAADVERMEFQLALRRRGISDQAVLRAMDEVPREHFVSPELIDSAYADQALPIACGQTISQPYVVAYMTEQLELAPQHHVLEIGTGSGYQAAVLSRLVRDVVSIERYRTLADVARERFKTLGFANVTVTAGDGFAGAPAAGAVRPNHRHRRIRCSAASAGRSIGGGWQDDAAAWTARRHPASRQADQDRARRVVAELDRGTVRTARARASTRIVTILQCRRLS